MSETDTRTLDLEHISSDPKTGMETMVLNLGPQHPSTHGVLRIVIELDGEVVVKSEPIIGYLHTGIEKECEYRTYHQIVPLIDRMDYLSSMNEEMGFIQASEKLFGIQAPPRAEFIRVICAELARITSHMVWLGTSALELNVSSVFMYTFRDREMLLDIFEMISGARMFPRYFRIGGVLRDVPRGFEKAVTEVLEHIKVQIEEYDALLTKNPIWKMRNIGVGVLTTEQCLEYGATGPVLRSTGVEYDIRKAFPYSAYPEFQFDIPTAKEGDAYSRYLLRLEEMRQSVRIVEQALSRLPDGPFVLQDRRVSKPHPHKGLFAPEGESYVTIESPRGEKGYWVIGDGSNKPLRMRMRSPSFAHTQMLPLMINGTYLADAVVAIASVDPVLGDVDR
jgi:NADH-quinone oxidoreductase subunit D